MMRADLRRTAPDDDCPACRRYAQAVADLDAATRERHHERRSRRAFDEVRPYPVGELSRELRRAASAMDRAHAGSLSIETQRPTDGPQPEGGPDRRRELEPEPGDRPRTSKGGPRGATTDGSDKGEGIGNRERTTPQP